MGLRDRSVDLGMKTMSLMHRAVLKASGGRLLASFGPIPVVELHTIGRSTGKRRTTMLTAPIHDRNRFVLIASKGGSDRNPQWYLNLVANPDVELTVHGTTKKLRARTADAAEKAELWPQIVAAYKGYEGYQQKTSRDIPVVVCEPR
ncbi:nitroreductase family deazaflavin-dependent oxidoreductase [Cryobacterium sp. 10I1]|uniref:nitroreductase family deazaflavin-dependent oxidoreductase n=1 Tax=Cryobacterium sp. 10I1 TaxID=3048578 RepID=UPI002B2238DF|nr:nitroreductase family deazaflavin-dependent oxidoreductase [Cryobacterium sp. 10I1]MEB0305434.1 nitroreductase family deazaflavin-dependent oxidoreductase [Cryobacterium sp. 10I1]